MQVNLEPDVQRAVDLLTNSEIPQGKLVGVAARIAELAPHLWGNASQEDVRAFTITPSPLSNAT